MLYEVITFENATKNIRVNGIATGGTEAPPRIIPRNPNEQSENEKNCVITSYSIHYTKLYERR